MGECWGYNRFLSLDRLKTFVVDDELKIHFGVRPTVFQTQVRDQATYIAHIESRQPGEIILRYKKIEKNYINKGENIYFFLRNRE